MPRLKYILTLSAVSGCSAYYYYHNVYRNEPSTILGKIVTKLVTNPTLPVTIHSAKVSKFSRGIMTIHLFNTSVQKGDEWGKMNGTDNYTRYSLCIEQVSLHLDFAKSWNLSAMFRHAEVSGVRGYIDRTRLQAAPAWKMPFDRHEWQFDEGFSVKDVLVSVKNSSSSAAFPVSIYTAQLPRLRRSWLLNDILSATSIIGSYDNSLFTYQLPQIGDDKSFTRHLRVDSLNIEHVNRGVTEGPISWIQRGRMAIDATVNLPGSPKLVTDCPQHDGILGIPPKSVKAPSVWINKDLSKAPSTSMTVRVECRLSNVRAHLPPLMNTDLSLVGQALARPVIAYLNEHRHHTFPLAFAFSLHKYDDLRGAWTIYESGIASALAEGTAGAFVDLVNDRRRTGERMRRVGLWSVYAMLKELTLTD